MSKSPVRAQAKGAGRVVVRGDSAVGEQGSDSVSGEPKKATKAAKGVKKTATKKAPVKKVVAKKAVA
ncbi:hypothetical protein ACFV23_32475 [Streptomyces sp. NPDC059627]